jgi:hypothetical protein
MNTKIPNRHVMIRIAILILFLLLLVAACSGPSEVNEGLIVVGNPTPRNDAAGLEISQVLFWLTTGATSNLSGYDVYFGNTPNPPLVEEDYQKTFYDTGDLIVSKTYFWRVVAKGRDGNEFHGDLWRFTTRDGVWITMNSRTTQFLSAVWALSDDDAFAVGNSGTIQRWDGSNWTAMNSGTPLNLFGVWAPSADEAFAVGSNGTIRHWNGAAWNGMDAPTSAHLRGVWGTTADDVFAVGDNGAIGHFDGDDWDGMSTPSSRPLTAVWGTSENNVFAVGSFGTILQFNGIKWSEMTSGTSANLTGVWCAAPDNVFVSGAN